MCFLPVTSSLVQVLKTAYLSICNYLLISFFNNRTLIYTDYSNIASWWVIRDTFNVAVIVSLYRYCLCGLHVHFACFLTHKSWISNSYHDPLAINIFVNFPSVGSLLLTYTPKAILILNLNAYPTMSISKSYPNNKVHGDNMGPTWVLWPKMGPMLAPETLLPG